MNQLLFLELRILSRSLDGMHVGIFRRSTIQVWMGSYMYLEPQLKTPVIWFKILLFDSLLFHGFFVSTEISCNNIIFPCNCKAKILEKVQLYQLDLKLLKYSICNQRQLSNKSRGRNLDFTAYECLYYAEVIQCTKYISSYVIRRNDGKCFLYLVKLPI